MIAISLRTDGSDLVVQVECAGEWVEVIRVNRHAEISHIVEPWGVACALERHRATRPPPKRRKGRRWTPRR